MTEAYTESQLDRLLFYLKGDVFASQLAIDLIFLAHLIDDIYDEDVERSREEVKVAFRKLLVDIPGNPFYQRWYTQLSTLIASAYLLWMDSTLLEKGSKDERFICFQIRNTTLNVIHHFILLTGGPEWAQQVGVDFWKEYGIPFSKWIELENE